MTLGPRMAASRSYFISKIMGIPVSVEVERL